MPRTTAPRRSATRKPPAAQRNLRRAKAALYRQHIMDAAEAMFAREGFAQTRMQAVAQAAGVSLATLYQQFKGKEELHRAILIARDAEMLSQVMERAQNLLQAPQSVEQILALIAVQLSFLLEHPNYLNMQLQDGHAWYHSAARPSAEEQHMWERGLAMMEQVFTWGTRNQLFISDAPADQARLTLALQQARLASWVSGGMLAPHAAVIAAIQADFVRCFCRPAVAARLLAADGATLKA